MKIKVNDYVRTKRGQIHKITDLKGYYENDKLIEDRQYVYINNHFSGWDLGQFKELIIKTSPNIIDLIEVGDYVNGVEVENIDDEWITMSDTKVPILKSIANGLIVSILTKEMFEQMEYKVGE